MPDRSVKNADISGWANSRYEKNRETLSREDQEVLAGSTVCIIGLGGLGGPVCEMLARTGVGHLVMVDKDRFEPSNLNRQLFSREDLIGQEKALAAQQRIQSINSTIRCTPHAVYMDEDNVSGLIQGADLVMDCLDSIEVRFILQDAAQQLGIPIVSGAIAGVAGQVTTIFPEDSGFDMIYPRDPSAPLKGAETVTGNLSFCAMMVAAIQVSEAVKVLLKKDHILRNQLLIIDMFSNTFETVDLI